MPSLTTFIEIPVTVEYEVTSPDGSVEITEISSAICEQPLIAANLPSAEFAVLERNLKAHAAKLARDAEVERGLERRQRREDAA